MLLTVGGGYREQGRQTLVSPESGMEGWESSVGVSETPAAARSSPASTAASEASVRLPAVKLPEAGAASLAALPASSASPASGPSPASERQPAMAHQEAGEAVSGCFLESMVDQCTCPITLVRP